MTDFPRPPFDVLHFSFTVSDIKAATKWYVDVLGLELVHTQRQENAYTPELVGIPGAILEIAQFRIPGVSPGHSTHMLELVEYVQPRLPRSDQETNRVGVAHLALLVTDIHERYEWLASQGVRFRNPPVEITAGVNQGGWACYFHDPDGITLELLQRPTTPRGGVRPPSKVG
jgi:catechol 2,3-dioxygenase-like lactoylglutathione lyase family enzyme